MTAKDGPGTAGQGTPGQGTGGQGPGGRGAPEPEPAGPGDGGVRELLGRAAVAGEEWAAVPRGGPPPDAAATDRLLGDLTAAEERAGDEPPGGRGARRELRAARGTLLALRHLAVRGRAVPPGGVPQAPDPERAEALALLREAREAEPVTERENQARAALTRLLIRLLVPPLPPVKFGGRQSMLQIMTVGATFMAPGGSFLRDDLAEVRTLLTELKDTADPADHPDIERWTALLEMLHGAQDRDSLLRLGSLVGESATIPAPWQNLMGAAMEMLKALPDGEQPTAADSRHAARSDGAPAAADAGDAGAAAGTIPEQVALDAAELLPLMELFAPGVLHPEEMAEAVDRLPLDTWQEQATAGLSRFGLALRTGDAEGLVEAAEPLLRAGRHEELPDGVAAVLQAGLLSGAALHGGSLADAESARRLLTENLDLEELAAAMPAGSAGRDLMEMGRALLEYQRVCDTDEDDLDGFDDIGERLLDMRRQQSEDAASAGVVLFVLGFLQLRRGMAIGRAGGQVGPPLRRALMYLRESRDHPAMPVALRGMLAPVEALCSALEQYLDPSAGSLRAEIERVRASLGGPRVAADQDLRARLGIAIVLDTEHERRGDPAVLEEAVRELETARAEIGDHTGSATAQDIHRMLADHYRRRGAPGDTGRALAATERLLELIAEDVLLQIGAEHGLDVARRAADRGVTAAAWAAETGDAATALRVLEAGRALVLRAVAASASVPEQLEACGEPDLAEQWRAAARAGTDTGTATRGTAAPATAVSGTPASGPAAPEAEAADGPARPEVDADSLIPSTLRRRALRALRRPGPGADGGSGALGDGPGATPLPATPLPVPPLGGGPSWQEVADTADAAGVDAVVHLLVGQGDGPGWALVVRPGHAPLPLELAGLSAGERGPLERYLDAARDRSALTAPHVPPTAPGRAEAVAAWEAALSDLCDWAGPAVMGPVLDTVRPGRPARPDDPVRVVLLPAGNLGTVPWHAARLADRTPTGERPLYAVDHAVLGYAASGAEFVRSTRRERLPLAGAPVLVADPRATLPYAEHEVEALRRSFYRDARCYGFLSRNVFDVDGTPDELLPLLPGGSGERPATLVEFSVHGFAGGRPTVSGLLLHTPDGGAGAEDAGLLTVRRLLGAPSGGGPRAAGAGPLIVLSACETDLTTRDHDETLTLTTAFVARGAADVIGSKWSIGDASSAVLMYVLHHALAAGADPARALRTAQLWALDADRPAIPGLPGPLAVRVEGAPALPVAAWAPFIHQGNPAPVRPEGNTVGHR
ncbi:MULTISPECIES: CHAT domain-containing protein [unclassified Streptomyces]|uniref:CHAT domain-containing protein n=1 Tax=unclassified Streptomyces TaxID=2593676 RepID=UPI003822282D